MRNCEQCGSPLVDGSRFCGNCGRAQTPAETARTTLSEHKINALADISAEETVIGPRQSGVDISAEETMIGPRQSDVADEETFRFSGNASGDAGTPVAPEQERRVQSEWQIVGGTGDNLVSGVEMVAQPGLGMPQPSGSVPVVPGTPHLAGNMPVVPGTPHVGNMPVMPGTPHVPGGVPSVPGAPQGPSPLVPSGPGMHPSLGPNAGQLPQLPTTPPVTGAHPALGPHYGQLPQGAGQGASGGPWSSAPHYGQLPQGPGPSAGGGSLPGVHPAASAPNAMHPAFTQPHTAISTAAKTAKAGKLLAKPLLHQLWFWLAVPAALVVVAASALGTAYVFIPANLGLVGSQAVMSGLPMQVHGSHFVPGGQVTLNLDGKQTVAPLSAISVSGTGEFEAQIAGTENWSLGAHTIHASESTLAREAVLSFKLLGNSSTVAPSVSSFDTSTGACQYAAKTGWACSLTLGIQGGRGKVHWAASSTGVSGVAFSPASGVLEPGQSQNVAITVPDMVCPAQATFTISGWANPLSIKWSCAAPLLQITGTLCPASGSNFICPVPISLQAGSQGMANWTVTSPSPGVTIQPGSGILSLGQTQTVNISVPQSECRTAQFIFAIVGGKSETIGMNQSTCP